MTYLIKDIKDRLAASTPIAADVTSGGTVHIYDGFIPQKAEYTKAIVLNLISAEPVYSLRGEAGVHESIVQIDYYTTLTRKAANDGAELIRNRLSGFRGTFGTGCYGTCHLEGGLRALPVDPQDASDKHIRRVTGDYKFVHSAAVPTFT